MQSHMQVPCGLQGKMRCVQPAALVLARIKPGIGFAGMSWPVSALPCVTPGLTPVLLSVPTPLMVPAGVVQDAAMAC